MVPCVSPSVAIIRLGIKGDDSSTFVNRKSIGRELGQSKQRYTHMAQLLKATLCSCRLIRSYHCNQTVVTPCPEFPQPSAALPWAESTERTWDWFELA